MMAKTTNLELAATIIVTLLILSVIILIMSIWGIFKKAGYPGWYSIIPIYNIYLLFKISIGKGKELLFLLLFIPYLNIIVYIYLTINLCKHFNKGIIYTILTILFPVIFLFNLGCGVPDYNP